MTSSDTEIVSVSTNQIHSSSSTTTTNGQSKNPNPNPNIVLIIDVFGASAFGDLDKLRKFVEIDGQSVSSLDPNGYYALQWASLNNFPIVVQYIIEHGGNVHATDNAQRTALHWAAVRGCIAVADVLLQNGARVEATDANGYRAVHVAAQYGQTATSLQNTMLVLMHLIMMGGARFIGLHIRNLLIQLGYFSLEMLTSKDRIKKVWRSEPFSFVFAVASSLLVLFYKLGITTYI